MITEAYTRCLTASARTIEQQALLFLLLGGAGNKHPSTGLAGVAAIVVTYINASEHSGPWEETKTLTGDQTQIHDLSIEPEARKVSLHFQYACRDPIVLKKKFDKYV